MTSLYNNTITRYYDFVFTDLGDPRTNHWLLLGSPMPGATILGLYLYFVLSWGPRYMLHRKPYDLQNVLVVYNFVQVLASIWLFWEAMDAAWWTKYSWKCEPVDWSRSPDAMRIAWAFYMYFLAKISELLDTVFFVLRKKDRQITFLHMYHHTVMPMISWGAAKYYPGGHGAFIGMINSFVHIIMYTYYMMAAMGPQFQKYLWWKKYITTLQLSQFCLAFLHSFQLLIYDCEYPRWSLFLIMPNAVFFYYLFNDFYNKAYGIDDSKPRRKPESTNGKLDSNGVANGHAGKSNGHVTKSNGHVTKSNGHMVKSNGHVTKSNGYTTNSNGHVSSENGNTSTSNGHVSNSNGNIPNGDARKSNGHQSPKKTQ